jgi:hypothetical protein
MKRAVMADAPCGLVFTPDDLVADQTAEPFILRGKPVFPAVSTEYAHLRKSEADAGFIAVCFATAHGGLFVNYTPEGARAAAAALLRLADRVESRAASQASAAIEAARREGGAA